MRKLKHIEPADPEQIFWNRIIGAFNEMIDQHNHAMEQHSTEWGHTKMRTKQETVDYCQAEIAECKRINRKSRQSYFDGKIAAYLSLVDFLEEKDEPTETTLVG
jgi:hypothetical protein